MTKGEVIKCIRHCCMLSQEAFAKELGVSFTTVNRWESGKCKPSYKAMKQISDYCEAHNLSQEIIQELKED